MAKNKDEDKKDILGDLLKEYKAPSAEHIISVQANYRVYSTGCLALDWAIGKADPKKGNMGIPQRAIVEHFGRNQSLKTAVSEQLAKNVLAEDENNYVIVLYAEESEMARWDLIGVPKEHQKRIISLSCYGGSSDEKAQTCERHLDFIREAIQDKRVALVIIDSVKALTLYKQLYDDKGNLKNLTDAEKLGMRATMMGEFLRDFKVLNKVAILYMLNQVSDKIALSPTDHYTNPQFTMQTPGGRAMEFECMLRINGETRPLFTEAENEITGKKVLIGWEASFRIIKNKFCKKSANRTAVANFYFDAEDSVDGVGFDNTETLLRHAEYLTRKGHLTPEKGIVRNGNVNWSICGVNAKGRAAALEALHKNQKVRTEMIAAVSDKSDWLYAPTRKEKKQEEIEEMF